jgi:CRISPR-associated protein (TIGR02710 family)
MTAPRVDLTPELRALRDAWRRLDRRDERNRFYARHLGAPLAKLFAELPLHGAPAELERARPRALISVLGFSWQPVALMAAWCRPERMLVLGTEESLAVKVDGEGVLSLIARIAGVPRDAIHEEVVDAPEEREVYRIVRRFLDASGIPAREVLVDPTGGKKSMSAAAALAGFVVGAPLVYVDYHEEDGGLPVPGTEYPRLLVNPLEVFGDIELRAVVAAFDSGDFREAAERAERLADRLYEPWEARCLAGLARGYDAWERLDFAAAREALLKARNLLDRFAGQGRWGWAGHVRTTLASNLKALDELRSAWERIERGGGGEPGRIEDGLPFLLWYLAAAERRLETERPSQAVLMVYAALERYVRLCLWVDHGLGGERPDYERVRDRLDGEEYDRAGRALFGHDYHPQDLQGPITFLNGAQLLRGLGSTRLQAGDLGPLRGLSSTRNACEYEHTWIPRPPKGERVEGFLERAKEIVARIAGGRGALDQRLERYRVPQLSPPSD